MCRSKTNQGVQLPRRHLLPARERTDLDLPAGVRLFVSDDAEVGEGLELGDELFVRQGAEGRLGEVGDGALSYT